MEKSNPFRRTKGQQQLASRLALPSILTIDSVYKGRISNKVCKIAKHFTEVNAIIVFLRQFANNNFEYMQQSQQEATRQHQQRLENLLVAPV